MSKQWISGTEQEYMEWVQQQIRECRQARQQPVEVTGSGKVYDAYHGEMPEDDG